MRELYVFCEGVTEQGFCKQVLQPSLFPQHDGRVHPVRVAHSRRHGVVHRGGVSRYAPLRNDVVNMLRQHQREGVVFTSMIDLYRLPKDFPGKVDAVRNPDNPRPYVETLEGAFGADIQDARFVPHLQLHEFETLLFADPEAFPIAFDDCDAAVTALKQIAASFPSVEHIDDGNDTAPSKRIAGLLPAYAGMKATAGPDIAELIGLDAIRGACPHFSAWIGELSIRLANP